MEIQWLTELVELLESSSLSALEIEEDGTRIRLERTVKISAPASLPPAAPKAKAPAAHEPAAQEVPAVAEQDWSVYKAIVSPMVGTYRTLSAIGKGDDTAVGAKVRKGQAVCIVEAMKLMNEITAEEEGEIVQVLVKDGDMVEFGQPLFRYQ